MFISSRKVIIMQDRQEMDSVYTGTQSTNKSKTQKISFMRFVAAQVGGLLVTTAIALRLRIPIDSLQTQLGQGLENLTQSGPLVSIIVYVAVATLIYRLLPIFSLTCVSGKVYACLTAALLSLTLIVPGQWPERQEANTGYPWFASSNINLHSSHTIFSFAYQWVIITAFLALILGTTIFSHVIPQVIISLPKSLDRYIRRIDFHWKHLLSATLVLFISWIPVLIINGPAIIPLDTMVQLIQMRGFPAWDPMMMTPLPGYRLTDHHPFLDSFIYGAFDRFGLAVGNELFGFVLYTWCQAILGAFSLILVLAWINKRTHVSSTILTGMLGMYILIPTYSSYMTIIMKDSTWIPIFTIWCVLFAEYVYRVHNNISITGWFLAGFTIIAILSGLTKKTGIFVSTPCLLVIAIFMRKRIQSLCLTIIPAIITLILIPSLLFPALHIAPGGKQEALGTPLAQVTKVLIDHQNDISAEDIAKIRKVLDIETAKDNWKPSTVDTVKHSFNTQATQQEIRDFEIVWIKLFFHYPIEYLKAVPFIRNSFLIGTSFYTSGSIKCGWGPSGGYAILPDIQECSYSTPQLYIAQPIISILNRVPPFSILGSVGLYVSWIPILSIGYTLFKRRYWNLIYFLPVILTWMNLLMIPAPQDRYSLGLLFPSFLFAVVGLITTSKEK